MGKTSDQKTVPAREGFEPGLLRIMESPHENPVHPSDDRRQHVWVTRRMLLLLGALALTPVAAAWVQYLVFGLPEHAPAAYQIPDSVGDPHGFPACLGSLTTSICCS